MKVLELRGYKSLRALNAFNTLMLGLKMLPSYMTESYADFFARIQEMPENDQKKMIKEAAMFVELHEDEVKALVCFCADKNGVPFREENLKNLAPDHIIEIIVEVCAEIAKIKIDMISDKEKKNSIISQST